MVPGTRLSRPRQPGLGGKVTMSTKVPIYLKHSSHKGKEKLRDLLSSNTISPLLRVDRFIVHASAKAWSPGAYGREEPTSGKMSSSACKAEGEALGSC